MSLKFYADGKSANVADVICGNCHRALSFEPIDPEIKYFLAFCSAECLDTFRNPKPGKVVGA